MLIWKGSRWYNIFSYFTLLYRQTQQMIPFLPRSSDSTNGNMLLEWFGTQNTWIYSISLTNELTTLLIPYSLRQNPFWENNRSLVNKFTHFMQPELLFTQKTTTCSYPQPDETSPQSRHIFPWPILILYFYLHLLAMYLRISLVLYTLHSHTNLNYDITSLWKTGKSSDTLPAPAIKLLETSPLSPYPIAPSRAQGYLP